MENENSSVLLDAAVALHEMFITLMEAGFSEHQALVIVADFLNQHR